MVYCQDYTLLLLLWQIYELGYFDLPTPKILEISPEFVIPVTVRIDRIFSKLHGTKLFSTFEIQSGYYNITVDENSRKCTAFTTEHRKYEFLCVPFGKNVTPNYFAMNMNEILKGLNICFACLDNIIIYSTTKREQLTDIRQLFDCLHRGKIKLKLTNVTFSNDKCITLDTYFPKKEYCHYQKN